MRSATRRQGRGPNMEEAEFPPGGAISVPSTFNKPVDSSPTQDDPKGSTFEDPSATTSYLDSASSRSDDMKADMGQTETSPHLDEIDLVQKDGPEGDFVSIECPESKMISDLDPLDAVMTELNRAIKMECMQWTHVFMESEQFEMLSSNEVDKLLEDAKALEENLIEQKERLLTHLKHLSQTLKLP